MSFLTEAFRAFDQAIAIRGNVDTPAAMVADLTLTAKSGRVQRLDPGAAPRNVDLPGLADGLADTNGHWFVVPNVAAGTSNPIVVRDPANATLAAYAGQAWGFQTGLTAPLAQSVLPLATKTVVKAILQSTGTASRPRTNRATSTNIGGGKVAWKPIPIDI